MIAAIRSKLDEVAPEARAYLFGSRATGKARTDSDWDILILLDKPSITWDDHDRIAYPIAELGWRLNEEINPILFTEEQWQRNSFTPFHHNVARENIEIL